MHDHMGLAWWHRVIVACCLFPFVALTSCSSLAPNPQQREHSLQVYLAQSQRLIVYYPSRLHLDEQIKMLGVAAIDERLIQKFHSIPATEGLIEKFLSRVPALAKGSTRIIEPGQLASLKAPPDTPVLFFSDTWAMHYQRLPPKLDHQRLELGVIAKIIPLGQVVSGKGTIALHTAAWEGRCLFNAFGGRYFPVDEWLADDAGRLRRGIGESQSACGEKMANEFLEKVKIEGGGQRSEDMSSSPVERPATLVLRKD